MSPRPARKISYTCRRISGAAWTWLRTRLRTTCTSQAWSEASLAFSEQYQRHSAQRWPLGSTTQGDGPCMHELIIGNTSLRRLTVTSETPGPVFLLTLQRSCIDMIEPSTPLSPRLCPATRSRPGSMSTMTLIKYSQEHRGSTSTILLVLQSPQ